MGRWAVLSQVVYRTGPLNGTGCSVGLLLAERRKAGLRQAGARSCRWQRASIQPLTTQTQTGSTPRPSARRINVPATPTGCRARKNRADDPILPVADPPMATQPPAKRGGGKGDERRVDGAHACEHQPKREQLQCHEPIAGRHELRQKRDLYCGALLGQGLRHSGAAAHGRAPESAAHSPRCSIASTRSG